MKRSLLTILIFTATLAPASAQHSSYQNGQPSHDRPTESFGPIGIGNAKLRELLLMHLVDYEVYVLNTAASQLQYKLYYLDDTGEWVEYREFEFASVAFESEDAADSAGRMMMKRFDWVLDFEIEAVAPVVEWEYVDTFDTAWEAHEFLELLMDVFGGEYQGKVVKVARGIPALR